MSDNEINAAEDPDFDPYMPDEHRIEDAVKVYMVFENGRWCLDALIQQGDPLDEVTGTRCSYEQPREDCAVCSTAQGLAEVQAADRAPMPTPRELLAMLATEFGVVVVPAAMAGPHITRLSEQIQQLLDRRSEVDQLGETLRDAFVAAVELSTYLNTQTRHGRPHALRALIARITGKPGA